MKKLIGISALLLLTSQTAFAEKRVLTIQDAIDLAMKRNEQVGITQAEVEISELTIKKAYSGLFPTLSIEGQLLKSAQRPATFNVPGADRLFDNWQQIGKVQLTQPVYTFGRLGGAIKLAKYQEKLTENSSLASYATIKNTIQSLFYNVLFFERTLNASKESYQNALKNKDALNKRVSFGRISQNDNLKMQADIASRKPQLIEAEKLYNSALIEIKSFLALEDDVELELAGNLEANIEPKKLAPDFDLSNLASIRLLENQYQMQSAMQDISKADFWPTLSFFASYGETAYYEGFQDNNFLTQETVAFGLNLNFTFELGGEKNKDYQISKVETRIKELEYQQGKRNVRLGLQNLYEQYEKVKEQLQANKTAVNLAKNSYKVALNSFANGSTSQTQLNDSELLLTNNKIGLAQTLLQLQTLKLEIEKLQTQGTKE